MPGPILVLNAGSSSLKAALFSRVARGDASERVSAVVDRIGQSGSELTVTHGKEKKKQPAKATDAMGALDEILAAFDVALEDLVAVGHRIVHGGPKHDAPCLLSPAVLDDLEAVAPLDPDHLPAEIALVRALSKRAPKLVQSASFDTAFHRTMPRVARLLPIPRRFEEMGVHRYGFHGLSYTYLVGELARVAGDQAARGHVVLAHLGSGASLAAVHDGKSVDTTMGFTPTGGIPMGTRTGDLDPGVLVHLLRTEKMNVDALDRFVNHEGGLLGVSGTSADMRDLLDARATDTRAADAVDLFCYEVRKTVGAFAAVLGGLDTLVFSGGIGERSAVVRQAVSDGLDWLGVTIDPARNADNADVVSTKDAKVTVRVMATDEESIILRETVDVIASGKANHDGLR